MSQATLSRCSLTERYAAAFPRSRMLHEQARNIFPNGVTHDLRYLEPFPVYVDRASAATSGTVEGRELIDFWVRPRGDSAGPQSSGRGRGGAATNGEGDAPRRLPRARDRVGPVGAAPGAVGRARALRRRRAPRRR